MSRLDEHPLYDTWRGIVARCCHPSSPRYSDYGGRGVKLCCHWYEPANFIADIMHEIGPRPAARTLDRINNDLGYQPGNVRWATAAQQVKNTRRSEFPPIILVPLNGTPAPCPAPSGGDSVPEDGDPSQRKTHSFRHRTDQWRDLEVIAKSQRTGACTFVGWAIDVVIGHTRCERCHATIPFQFGNLEGREMAEWAAEAIKEAAGQRCRAGHGPVLIGTGEDSP